MDAKRIVLPPCESKEKLSDLLCFSGVFLSSPCGGRGVCGKCKVKVIRGEFLSVADDSPVYPDEKGYILSCRVYCANGGEIEVDNDDGLILSAETSSYSGEADGVLDIGTTTLAMSFVSKTGEALATLSLLNPQKIYGGDVITRISKSREHLKEMQACVLDAVRNAAEEFLKKLPDTRLDRLLAVGNPTMLHIFCGVSPESMGAYPFTPIFTERKSLTGKDLNLPFNEVTLLPSASAFIGSDVVCGAQVCEMTSFDEPTLLIDIGTNGEMILCTGKKRSNRLLSTSAAAGPALEGANISCGVGGVTGGISRVTQSGNGPVFSTVNDGAPVGLCGSGLIDLVACLLDDEIIDETGYMEEDLPICGMHKTEKGISDIIQTSLSLTQRDIREFQLAKSAVRAGIDILVSHGGLTLADISRVFIAGGLGYYTDPVSAVRTGLLPQEFLGKTKACGNTALQGGISCLDKQALEKTEDIARRVETVSLNDFPLFAELFAEYMMFPE